MAISGRNFTIVNTIIDAFTSGGFPFNTDGFDIKYVRPAADQKYLG